jgi:enoyl-CoA hydratase
MVWALKIKVIQIMSDILSYSLENDVALLTMHNGKVNAFSHQLIDELNNALDQAETEAKAIVIAGNPGLFSAGFDLKVMTSDINSMRELVTKGSKLSRRLLAYPLPVVAACTGHAMAKGALILLSCDYRIGASGEYKIGLNEVQIGMTMHKVGMALASGRLTLNGVNRSVIHAEIFNPQTAVEVGFLDGLVAVEQVISAAQAQAQLLAKLDQTAYRQTKANIRAALLTELDQAIADDANSITGPKG